MTQTTKSTSKLSSLREKFLSSDATSLHELSKEETAPATEQKTGKLTLSKKSKSAPAKEEPKLKATVTKDHTPPKLPTPAKAAKTTKKEKTSEPKAKKASKFSAPAKLSLADRETALRFKYPHVLRDTIQFDEAAHKYSVIAKLECGHEHRVFTSDLFQVKACPACKSSKKAKESAKETPKVAAKKTVKRAQPKAKKSTKKSK